MSQPTWSFSVTLAHGAPGFDKLRSSMRFWLKTGISSTPDGTAPTALRWICQTRPNHLAWEHLQRLSAGLRPELGRSTALERFGSKRCMSPSGLRCEAAVCLG